MSFNAQRVTREQLVERSVFDYVKDVLINQRGYPADRVEFMEAFNTNLFQKDEQLAKTYVAAGFHNDDGGHPAELGSTMRRKQYVLEYWVVGRTHAEGKNVGGAIAEAVEQQDVIPLRDYTQPTAPVVDFLLCDPVRFERIATANPLPWQEFLFQLAVPVTDEYYV